MALLRKKKTQAKDGKKTAAAKTPVKKSTEEELAAVIAAAVYLNSIAAPSTADYKMTIKAIDMPYSPWSSKNHMMRKWPRKK